MVLTPVDFTVTVEFLVLITHGDMLFELLAVEARLHIKTCLLKKHKRL